MSEQNKATGVNTTPPEMQEGDVWRHCEISNEQLSVFHYATNKKTGGSVVYHCTFDGELINRIPTIPESAYVKGKSVGGNRIVLVLSVLIFMIIGWSQYLLLRDVGYLMGDLNIRMKDSFIITSVVYTLAMSCIPVVVHTVAVWIMDGFHPSK